MPENTQSPTFLYRYMSTHAETSSSCLNWQIYSICSLGFKIHILENTENVSSCFRALSKTNMMCLSNCMFRWFVWNQPFVYCAALNLWRIIKSWNWKLFRALEATVMATGIGCSPIIFYVCCFFCHCNHGAQVQGNVLKLSDAADPSAVQHKGVTQDHKPASP